MPVQITINGADASETLNELFNLSSGLGNKQASPSAPLVPQTPPAAPIQPPTQPYVAPPTQPQYGVPTEAVPTAPSYVQGSAPAQQPAPITGGVPIAAQSYTYDQLGVAAGPLVDAGMGEQLTAWINQFGAQSLMQLPKERYGDFATYLRSLGAKI